MPRSPARLHQIEVAWASDAKAKFSLFVDEKLVGTVTGDTSGA